MKADSRAAAREFCKKWLMLDPDKNPDIVMAFINGASWGRDQVFAERTKNPQYNDKTYERALHYHCLSYANGMQPMSELVQHFQRILQMETELAEEREKCEEMERKRFAIASPEPKRQKREFVQLSLF